MLLVLKKIMNYILTKIKCIKASYELYLNYDNLIKHSLW